jgi:hypothetical protein
MIIGRKISGRKIRPPALVIFLPQIFLPDFGVSENLFFWRKVATKFATNSDGGESAASAFLGGLRASTTAARAIAGHIILEVNHGDEEAE